MKFFHALRQDLNKTVINIGFLGAALMTCMLAFTGLAYMDTANGGKEYSILEALTAFDREFITSHSEFAALRLFTLGQSNYSQMFMPIIVAVPFMVSFCAERNNGLMRFTISRTGKLRYYMSKFFASMIGGGLAVFLGMMIFGCAVELIFPPLENYANDPGFYNPYVHGVTETVLQTLLWAFIYGEFSTLPAFFISSFCKNPYIITCLPFMLVYVWNTAIQKATIKLFDDMALGLEHDPTLFEKLVGCSPMSSILLSDIYIGEITAQQKYALIFNSIYLAAALTGFIIIMNLRTDKGS